MNNPCCSILCTHTQTPQTHTDNNKCIRTRTDRPKCIHWSHQVLPPVGNHFQYMKRWGRMDRHQTNGIHLPLHTQTCCVMSVITATSHQSKKQTNYEWFRYWHWKASEKGAICSIFSDKVKKDEINGRCSLVCSLCFNTVVVEEEHQDTPSMFTGWQPGASIPMGQGGDMSPQYLWKGMSMVMSPPNIFGCRLQWPQETMSRSPRKANDVFVVF